MTFALFEDFKSPLDVKHSRERRLRARHWRKLRHANTHYGTADLVARAFVILFLLVLAIFAAGGNY